MGQPKDKKDRVPQQGPVLITRAQRAEMLDISEDGMYIYTNTPFISGEIIQLCFPLEGEPIELTAKVRHVQKGIGIGVQFVDMSDISRQRIKDYIETKKGI